MLHFRGNSCMQPDDHHKRRCKSENSAVGIRCHTDGCAVGLNERQCEDHIEVGDLIFTVKPDTDKLKAGDIISFMDGNIAVTHRIIEVRAGADGKRSFVTKGDANNTEDPAVGEDAVFGLYKGRVPGLGDFAMFLQKPLGMAVFIGIPVCAFIIYDIIRRQRSSGKRDKETEELKAELERLRAAAGEKNPENEDGGNT